MLGADELAVIRADVARMLPDVCAILALTVTIDEQGGIVEAWGTATASVACRLDFDRGIETLTGGAIQPYSTATLTLPYGSTLTAANRILHNGTAYNVTSVDNGKSWPVSVRAKVSRV